MPAHSCRDSGRFALWAAAILAVSLVLAIPARAETLNVTVDDARIVKVPDSVATIVLGNPLVADASLQAGGVLVITGKSFGSTNLLALDRTGQVVMDKRLQVLGPSGSNLVVVYRGTERESYSCAPKCERRLTLGDSDKYFDASLKQSGIRSDQAQKPPPRQ